MTATRQLRLVLLGIVTIAWLGLGGEALCRFEENWRLDRLTLTKAPEIPPDPAQTLNAERALVQAITYQKGADPERFFLPPAPLLMPRNPELRERTAANPNESGQENFVWNNALLQHPDNRFIEMVRKQKIPTLFAFASYDGSPFPAFRLYPNTDFAPTNEVTNRWGWLGADTGVRKPPHTVRVGIIGDSTSHNMYALNLQSFLEVWAKHHGYEVKFEVFSIGRQGLGRDDELAALKYELGPMGLDYVYQYFAPLFYWDLRALAKLPPGNDDQLPLSHRAAYLAPLLDGYSVSGVARWAHDHMTLAAPDSLLTEPPKRRVIWQLPQGTRDHVVLSEARRSEYFGWLIGHLDAFKATAESIKATPLVSTERVCVWDGMTLRKGKNQHLYDVLNGPQFWPFTYADLRRMADAHNRVIEAWAAANAVTVVDIDGRMPARPAMCNDPWHDIFIGHRMRAWLIFQAMLPQLERDLRTGAVPRANGIDSDVHPYLSKPIERIDREKWLAKVESAAASAMPAK